MPKYKKYFHISALDTWWLNSIDPNLLDSGRPVEFTRWGRPIGLSGLDTIMILITKKMCCSFFSIFRALFTLDNCNTGKENVNVDRIFRLFLVYLISNVTWLRSIVNKNWSQNKPFFQFSPEIFYKSNKYIFRNLFKEPLRRSALLINFCSQCNNIWYWRKSLYYTQPKHEKYIP